MRFLGGEGLSSLSFDYSLAHSFVTEAEVNKFQSTVDLIHHYIHNEENEHAQYTGWVDHPFQIQEAKLEQIERTADMIQAHSDVLLVIGVGGSYLGARAAIEMLNYHFTNLLPREKWNVPHVIFVGHHLSSTYIAELIDLLSHYDFSINVISKSGTTTEPAIAFRIFRSLLEKRYGVEGARKRIVVTTDKEKGALKALADEKGYVTFTIPDDIGGRYSVLTPVGLLPMAVSGINIRDVLFGATNAASAFATPNLDTNLAYQYAVIRNLLYEQGKAIEALVTYEPSMKYFSEWWKQLFGESEGKEGKGIFPAALTFPTDLHSLGQYIQEGQRNLFETVIKVREPKLDVTIEKDLHNLDGLNYLADKTVDEVGSKSLEGALVAHTNGGVPNLVITIPSIDAYTFGYLVYFFKKACAMSGYLQGVNPFDQPGVEAYKNNMYALLGKPGFEDRRVELERLLASEMK